MPRTPVYGCFRTAIFVSLPRCVGGRLARDLAYIRPRLGGFVNGILLTRLDLPHPFVSTLGMKNVLWGLALVITGSKSIAFTNTGVDNLMWIGGGSIGKTETFPGIPFSFILVLIVFCIFHVFLTRSALGRQIYCVGGNPEAARLSGIPSKNVLTFVYSWNEYLIPLLLIRDESKYPVTLASTSPLTEALSLCAARSYSSVVPSLNVRWNLSPLDTGGICAPYMEPSTKPSSSPLPRNRHST